jgi:hypothetical protein
MKNKMEEMKESGHCWCSQRTTVLDDKLMAATGERCQGRQRRQERRRHAAKHKESESKRHNCFWYTSIFRVVC